MSALQANPFLLAGGGDGYEIERSLRFESSDSAYLSRTPSSAGNLKTWTFSCWVKRTKINSGNQAIFGARLNNGRRDFIGFEDDNLRIQLDRGYFAIHETEGKIRDTSAWYHFVFVWNTTVSTSTDRMKIYINNERVGGPADGWGYPNQNEDSTFNNNCIQYIGARNPSGSIIHHFDGYIADVHFIDGQALAPTDFGETDDNNVWQAIKYAGTFGTNGYHLDFADNSSNAALGTDTSGNSNTWTVNNLTATIPASIAAGSAQIVNGSPSEGTAINNLWNGAYSSYPGDFLTGADGRVLRVDWSPGLTNVTSIRYYSYNGSDRHNVNSGGWSSNSGSGQGWKTAYSGSAFTLTRLELQKADGASYVKIGAIEINGVVVGATVPPGDIDSLRDSPSQIADQSDSGAGGEVISNYATLNPLDHSNSTFAEGNLQATIGGGGASGAYGNVGITSGKYYWEVTPTTIQESSIMIGIANLNKPLNQRQYGDHNGWAWYSYNGNLYHQGSASSFGASYGVNDVLGFAADMDAGTVTFYKNNSSQGTITGLSGKSIVPYIGTGSSQSGQVAQINFGQRAFAYSAPSGYKCLCTANLPEPTIADGSLYFDTKLYTGNGGSNRAITGLNFSPDFLWIKRINQGTTHMLVDAVRGADKLLGSNATFPESTVGSSWQAQYGNLDSFDSSGFTVTNGTSSGGNFNSNNGPYVAWAWDAGSSTVTNTSGTMTSQVRANPTAGFSIATYTSPNSGSNQSFGHGLNIKPDLVIVKNRDSSYNWDIYLSPKGYNSSLTFSSSGTRSGAFSSEPSSTIVNTSSNYTHTGTNKYVAYCFSEIEGYSAIREYQGNGSADGTFIYTGFKPAFMLQKSLFSGEDWMIFDNKRDTVQPMDKALFANLSNAETASSTYSVDFVSNGIKMRTSSNRFNNNGGYYILIAFAEHPFKTARAR